MGTYTKRVQAVLTEEQFALLNELAAESGKTISMLIREAVEKIYLDGAVQERREDALHKLLSLEAPVADWKIIEDEIIRGALS
jgi:predicted DNA-binding protein